MVKHFKERKQINKKIKKKIKKEPLEGNIKQEVIEQGEIFDADSFLEGLTQQWKQEPRHTPDLPPLRNPSSPRQMPHPLTRGDTEIVYNCPIHSSEVLQKKETVTEYGYWEYYRCPVAKCFVCCGVDRVEYYVDAAKRQLHDFYLENPLNKLQCYCERPLIVSQSQSEKNPGRMFFRCSKRNCEFFQWVDQTPSRNVRAWLLAREHPDGHDGYPRPQDIFKPERPGKERVIPDPYDRVEKDENGAIPFDPEL